MIVRVCGEDFVLFKAAPKYLGYMVSTKWLQENEGRKGFPKRVRFSERKTGYLKSDLDAWRRRRINSSKRKAA